MRAASHAHARRTRFVLNRNSVVEFRFWSRKLRLLRAGRRKGGVVPKLGTESGPRFGSFSPFLISQDLGVFQLVVAGLGKYGFK